MQQIVKALIVQKIDDKWHFIELIRASHKRFPGMGDLPGGKVEENESLLSAIKRETFEETGIAIDHFEYFISHNLIAEHVQEYVYCALAINASVILDPAEHTNFSWIPFNEIQNSTLHPNLKDIISAHTAIIEDIMEKL